MLVNWGVSAWQRNFWAMLPVSVAILCLVGAYGLVRKGRLGLATNLTLGTLAILVTVILWAFEGLHDGALLAYPGILVFAAILGRDKLFAILLGFMVLNMALLAGVSMAGWHVFRVPPVTFGTFIGTAVILIGSGMGVLMMARDQRKTLAQLKAENLRVHQSQGHIDFLTSFDSLTGLPNRATGRDRLQQAVLQAQRNGCRAALLHLDLDHFKTINDSLGHSAGDQVLVETTARIQAALNPGDTLCRQSGDEFLVILGDLVGEDEAANRAGRIMASMDPPFRIQALEVAITASMGIALYPEDGRDFETLLQQADTAMYQAKASGRNNFRFFDAGMNTTMLKHLHLASALRPAMDRDELLLHYQPQFDLASGRIIGAEALLRWRHPEMGLIPPATFIPVAEASGLIGGIGKWALEEACRQARRWRDLGMDLVMSVNLSPAQFKRDDLEHSLLNAMEAVGLPASALELELTESMLLEDTPALTQKLRNLRAMGLSFSIDDFGTGYSNLSYLQRFEVERLKIDQSFVRRLPHSTQDEAIVHAIIQMAKSLHLGTVAEGIEDQATLDRLKALGCTTGQGFYWSRALSAEDFEAFYRTYRGG
jgi:diguanylate cyclase (GGDEF)-like protein